MIPAGKLNHLIRIESAGIIRGGTGQKRMDWTNPVVVCERRAQFISKGGREFEMAKATWPELSWMIRCRGRADVTTAMRVVTQDGRTMDILAAYSEDGHLPKNAELITLICREGV